MKEKIYTIPINEAVDLNSECPLCIIAEKLERDALDYTLGAAMMEPDYRMLCNEKGFCNSHFSKLFKMSNKLSLSLILDTRLEELRKQFSAYEKQIDSRHKKSGLFKKTDAAPFQKPVLQSCVICEKINNTIDRYAEVFFYMWEKDSDFKERILSSKGFCMPHFYYLCQKADRHLKNPDEFIKPIYEKQRSELERLQEEIHRFTLKFDYRNKDMPWENAKDAPLRTIEKTAGYIDKDEKTHGE